MKFPENPPYPTPFPEILQTSNSIECLTYDALIVVKYETREEVLRNIDEEVDFLYPLFCQGWFSEEFFVDYDWEPNSSRRVYYEREFLADTEMKAQFKEKLLEVFALIMQDCYYYPDEEKFAYAISSCDALDSCDEYPSPLLRYLAWIGSERDSYDTPPFETHVDDSIDYMKELLQKSKTTDWVYIVAKMLQDSYSYLNPDEHFKLNRRKITALVAEFWNHGQDPGGDDSDRNWKKKFPWISFKEIELDHEPNPDFDGY